MAQGGREVGREGWLKFDGSRLMPQLVRSVFLSVTIGKSRDSKAQEVQ